MHSLRNCRRRRDLGLQLWECRFKRQWTLAQTSALINDRLSPETIERIELGKHSIHDIYIIAPLCELYEKDFVIQLTELTPEQIEVRKKAAAQKKEADRLAKKSAAQKKDKRGVDEEQAAVTQEASSEVNEDTLKEASENIESASKDKVPVPIETVDKVKDIGQGENLMKSDDILKKLFDGQEGDEPFGAERECLVFSAIGWRQASLNTVS